MNTSLDSPVSQLPLVGPAKKGRLEKLGIKTVRDLLYHLPFRYEDYSLVSKIAALQEGEVATVKGKLESIKNEYTRGRMVLQKSVVSDETGTLEALWFNQRFLVRTLHPGDFLNLSGRVEKSGRKLILKSPEYELASQGHALRAWEGETIHTGRLVPIYPETAGISSKWLRRRIYDTLESRIKNQESGDTMDKKITEAYGLLDLATALCQIHFPDSFAQAEKARRRLAFEELLTAQIQSHRRKEARQQSRVGNKFRIVEIREQLKTFINHLPFTLTSAQKRAIGEIYKDLARDTPMNRLLQGDVGSGKTVVAALAMLAAYLNDYQAVLMAPTEILARQHYQTLAQLLSPLRIGVGIATGSTKNYSGYNVLVGTHALLAAQLNLAKLGLAVIDEQHRFGVSQRAKLAEKGTSPHILTMTATPIPRTVALTLYGDLDLSVLDEMPKNRLPVKTWAVPAAKRAAAYEWIKEQQTQTFIICPLIEESTIETMKDIKAVKTESEKIKTLFPGQRVGLLHGRLKNQEKEAVLTAFRQKELDILVATPVVEVGIDIPAATIMVIEGADRFGLAQLHQLRGRVGRGGQQAYCLLFTDNDSAYAYKRLKHMERLHDGRALSELDLKLRGPGERFGLAQHGRWDLKIADFSDTGLIENANKLAEQFLSCPADFPVLSETLDKSTINIVPN